MNGLTDAGVLLFKNLLMMAYIGGMVLLLVSCAAPSERTDTGSFSREIDGLAVSVTLSPDPPLAQKPLTVSVEVPREKVSSPMPASSSHSHLRG